LVVRIGILAKRGPERCIEKWSPTAKYLSNKIPEKTFIIVPINFAQIYSMVEKATVDFILVNPSFYVELENLYKVNRIATLKNNVIGGTTTVFGGVIFCKKQREDIRRLNDLKKKSFMAVSETSFGGWRTAWRELKETGINPFKDFASISFGGTHDAVIYAVRDGKVDAGTVRTDALERMTAEGKICLDDFYVIHEHGGGNLHLPSLHSTREYPEWPIAKLKHTSNEVAEKVAVALINMPRNSAAAQAARCYGWTIPLSYQSVHECLKELKVGPYKNFGKITLTDIIRKYWALILIDFFTLVLLTWLLSSRIRLNRKVNKAHQGLKLEVKERIETEAALRKSEERYKGLFMNMGSGVAIYEVKGDAEDFIFTDFNKAAEKIDNQRKEDLIGRSIFKARPQVEEFGLIDVFREVWKTGKPKHFPITFYQDERLNSWYENFVYKLPSGEIVAIFADETDQRQIYEALRKSEDRFQKLFNSVNDVVWAADLDGKMLYINAAVETVYGKPASEFLKDPEAWIAAVHPEDRKEALMQSKLLIDKGRVENRYRIIAKDGTIKWIIDRKSVVNDKTGKPVQIGGIATDITKQTIINEENIRINRALKLLSESNRIIVHSNDEFQFLHDICRNIVEIGGYRLAWVGFAKQDRNKKVSPVAQYGFKDGFLDTLDITWDDTEQGRSPAGTAIREKRPVICKHIATDPDFSIWKDEAVNRGCASAISFPIILNNQAIGSLNIYAFEEDAFGSDETRLLEKLARDFTFGIMTIRSQKKRRRAEQALKIEHGKLQSVLNDMGESIYIVNKDLNIEFQNTIFIKYFGDHKGKKCYKSIYKQNDPCRDCLIPETLRTNSIQRKETDLCRGNKYYDLTFSPLKEKVGTDKVIVFIRDITEQKFLRAEAARAGHLASLGELAAGVAHEINNPITGIISIAEVVSDHFHKTGGDVELPSLIIKEGERIGKIVNNLLSFARDREEEHSPVHINNIFNDTFALTQKQISKDGIHLSIAIPPDIPKIKARRREIQQVFLNIISNARYALNKKFPKPNEDKIFKVNVETIEVDGKRHVRIIFYDRGTGISKDIMDKVSNPFFSTKPQGEGTGLGLSISHGIINSHKGKLWFESQEEKYTKAMIDLPVHNG
jgi:PAS domain S-box-containing protein